jgi:protein-L-isoaspartate(D-aspartate) O-methyltransferase
MCVTDAAVLDAVGAVPRHMFTPRDLDQWPTGAYRDYSQVIGFGATISTPHVQALMTQLLQLSGQGQDAKVLEIGTGSGYQTALLVQMGWDVYTVSDHCLFFLPGVKDTPTVKPLLAPVAA